MRFPLSRKMLYSGFDLFAIAEHHESRAEPEGDFSGWYFLDYESEFVKGTSDNLPLDFYANLDSDLYTIAFQHPEIVYMLHKRPGKAYMLTEKDTYEEVTEY